MFRYRLTVSADFDSEAAADAALAALEEAVAKHNGDLQEAEVEDLALEGEEP